MVPQVSAAFRLVGNKALVDNTAGSDSVRNNRSIRQQFPEEVVTRVEEKIELARLGKRSVVIAECCSLVGLSSEVCAGGHKKKAIMNLACWLGERFIKDRAHLRELLEEKVELDGVEMQALIFEGTHSEVSLKRQLKETSERLRQLETAKHSLRKEIDEMKLEHARKFFSQNIEDEKKVASELQTERIKNKELS